MDLDRRLDEDLFVQVPGETPTQWQSQEHSGQTSEQVGPSSQPGSTEQAEDSELPEISKELNQTEQNMRNTPILQTPLNEEKNPKRDREDATPSSIPADQTYAKRQRLNPFYEQEYTEETIANTVAKRTNSVHTIPSGGTPSTSQFQVLGRQQSTEVSSFRTPFGQIQDINEKYKEIKARNEKLKAQTYVHYLRLAPTN